MSCHLADHLLSAFLQSTPFPNSWVCLPAPPECAKSLSCNAERLCVSFPDEHPGGDEVLFNEAGKDATEAFEDVGHSDESRELLEKYEVGTFQGVRLPSWAPSLSFPSNWRASRPFKWLWGLITSDLTSLLTLNTSCLL